MSSLLNKTLFITGASRGIGKEIALRAARDGANVVIAAKTANPDARLPGTVYTAAEEVRAAGGQALPLIVDVREEEQVVAAVSAAVEFFGGIDILVNNASAINLSKSDDLEMKRYDLMMDINVRGSYLCAKTIFPYLVKANNPHVLSISPPIDLSGEWFCDHPAYTASKFSMSMISLGLAAEWREHGIASNALWPRTIIATSALNIASPLLSHRARTPAIMADAAWYILTRPSREFTGKFLLDEQVLRDCGVRDFGQYLVNPDEISPQIDMFVRE